MKDLIPLLPTAIGPVILISGVGLLLLSMTNRFGRIIDRSRILAHEMRSGSARRGRWASSGAGLVTVLFSACLLTLIASLVAFLQEINESLSALKLALYGERHDL